MEYIAFACQCVIGLVFAVSALSKVVSRNAFNEFRATLPATGLVPARWQSPVAIAVIALEFATATLLAAQSRAGFLVGALLLLGFCAVIVAAIRSPRKVVCRCFGPGAQPLGLAHLVRNGLLLIIAGSGAWAMGSDASPFAHLAGTALSVAAAIVIAGVLIRFDELIDVFRIS